MITTMSTAHISFLYSKDFTQDKSILNAIAKDSQVTKSIFFKEDSIKFQGDYPVF